MGTLLEQILNHKEEPGTVYGSLWPTKYKVDSKGNPIHGTLAFDPGAGMLGSLARSAHELLTVPGNVVSGKQPLTNDLGPRLAGDMFNLGVGAGSVAGPAGRSVAGMFTGPGATGWSHMAVDEAERMEDQGEHPDTIWHQTGLFRGGDGNWRGEISDSNARLKTENMAQGTSFGKGQPPVGAKIGRLSSLGDVLDHPDLYREYPHMRDMTVSPLSLGQQLQGLRGTYDPGLHDMSIAPGKTTQVLSTMLHETQHAIDTLENRQNGAAPSMFIPQPIKALERSLPGQKEKLLEKMRPQQLAVSVGEYEDPRGWDGVDGDPAEQTLGQVRALLSQAARGKLSPEEQEELRSYGHEPWMEDLLAYHHNNKVVQNAKRNADDLYNRTGGEVMARNVQNRLKGWQPDLFGHGTGQADPMMIVRRNDGMLTHVDPTHPNTGFNYGYMSPSRTEDVGQEFQLWAPKQYMPGGSRASMETEGDVPLFKTNPFKLADEHQQDVTGLETQAYTTAMKPKGGSAPALGKPELRLVQGSGAGGDRPNFLLDRQGNYLGMFPSNMDAQSVKKMAADHVGLGQYKAGIDTATTNMSPQQRADKIAALKEMVRQPVRTMSGRTPAQEKAYMAAVKQQQLQKQNANVLSLNRATVPSFGEHHTVEQLPTGLFRVTRPNGDQIYYNAAGDWVGGGQPSIAQRSSISEFLKRGEK